MKNLKENNIINVKMIIFSVGEQEYCIPIISIKEIQEFSRVTILPFAPHYVCGAMNLRGTIITIVDLAKYLNIPPKIGNQRRIVIVIESKNSLICGILVDSVITIDDININNIQYFYKKNNELSGIFSIKNHMIGIINIEIIFGNIISNHFLENNIAI